MRNNAPLHFKPSVMADVLPQLKKKHLDQLKNDLPILERIESEGWFDGASYVTARTESTLEWYSDFNRTPIDNINLQAGILHAAAEALLSSANH